MSMSAMEADQLQALRDRVEEDFRRAEENYRLDIAAIEHLQRRFFGAVSSTSTRNYSETTDGSNRDSAPTLLPLRSNQATPQNDVLEGSLRAMFRTGTK